MASGCAACKLRAYAEKHPRSFRARLWRWHTKWCPGWRAYQRELVQVGVEDPDRSVKAPPPSSE
jgi:hypothetical protein